MLGIREGGSPPAAVNDGSLGGRTPDELETDLLAAEAIIAKLRGYQSRLLRELHEMKIYRADGSRSMRDWTAARLDVSHDTARALLIAAKAESLLDDASFDRVVATARLVAAGGDAASVEWSRRLDINGVRRLVAHRRRMTRVDEEEANREQHLRVQPNIDKSVYYTTGTFGGLGGRVIETFLQRLADELPTVKDEYLGRDQRQAAALIAHAEDYLGSAADSATGDSGAAGPAGIVNIHVDGVVAGETAGEAGAEIEYGPRIGPLALEELLCTGRVRVVVHEDGAPIVATHATGKIPSHIRAFVAKRDAGCTIDGCNSRYRLEPHHIALRAHGGTNDPDNLTTLCWFHHHIVVHRYGRRLDPLSPPGRRRFLPRRYRAPP